MNFRTSNVALALLMYAAVFLYAALGVVGMYQAAADHHPILFVVQPFVPFLAPAHGLLHLIGAW